jgi:type III secretory pathway component EscV
MTQDNQPKGSSIITIPATVISDDKASTNKPETSGIVFVNDFGEDPFLLGHVVNDSAMLGILYVLGTMIGFAVHPFVAIAIAAAGANDFVNAQRREKEGENDKADPLSWLIGDSEDEDQYEYDEDDEIATVPVKKEVNQVDEETEVNDENIDEVEMEFDSAYERVNGTPIPRYMRPAIHKMRKRGMNKAEIIELQFGVVRGNGKAYQTASRIYDTIVYGETKAKS